MATSQQKSLFHDYEGFVEKFKPKKTTDDCYTPAPIYDVVAKWACERYGLDPQMAIRPFFPGGDYRAAEYPEGGYVLDNPPFSILSEICRHYQGMGVPFFLFAPALTTLKPIDGVCAICTGANVTFENGAKVPISFLTNMEGETRAMSAPSLLRALIGADRAIRRENARTVPKYEYPDDVVTAAKLEWYSKHGTDFSVGSDSVYIVALDAQRAESKTIFGGGYLLSEKAAAEKATAEKAAAEKAAARIWELSDRERSMQRMLAERGGIT